VLLESSSGSATADAELFHKRALQTARDQDAKWFVLRSASGLARFWGERGNQQQARHLLASVYDWFTEGFDTLDLRDAKALLDELG